ncbi:NAD-dependent succinate-semialdehyde dehydrogenase [Paraburkholderia oxyphila]|uniref:NAD-dependent succinate-semialdehyde dehydrogenase n=1 Tax=Paraburkholderia oxyphila TaxID=614212 RepID=UPI000486CEC7|nr:NAD-dependent succinate-semialdehyde dehydrogenase [Paraburkholderia oxyphila]
MNTYATPSQAKLPGPPEIPTDLLIGGEWRAAQGAGRFDVIDPSSGRVLTSVADGTVSDGMAAVEAADQSAKAWAATAPRARSKILQACYESMMEHQAWLAELISLENGKALDDARGEVTYAAEFFRWYAEEGVRLNGELNMAPGGANRILVQYAPVGISLLITPWNLPAAMATRKIAPALAAGCTCILKPAEETPLTALAIAKLMLMAGLPAGVLNIVTTTDPGPLASAILHDPRVRKLSFTGSTEVGRILLREAADNIVSPSMELGGNAPFLVFDDADLEAAIEGALAAKMRHGGEACIAANRFLVQRGIHDAFAERLTERMGALNVGDGCAVDTQCGAMINAAAVGKIERLVDDAKTRGARVLVGGTRCERPGFFYPPTVLVDIDPGAAILQEEIFGPVAALTSFDTVDEAIALANASKFGLGAYVYTSDLKLGLRVSEQIESGMIGLNRGVLSDPAGPFGGVKQSGLGREGSHHGIREFTEARYIAVEW